MSSTVVHTVPVSDDTGSINADFVVKDCSVQNREGEVTTSCPAARGHYMTYSMEEKQEVLRYADMHGVRQASRTYKIPKSTLGSWKTMNFDAIPLDKRGRLEKTGRPLSYGMAIEEKLIGFVLEQRELQLAVTIDDLCIRARDLVTPENPTFRASRCWATRFMNRHDLVLRAKTSMAQRLPVDLEEKIASFHDFVRRQRERDDYDDMFIVNMDETPVYFDIVPGKTLET
jgi:hypothetical protein